MWFSLKSVDHRQKYQFKIGLFFISVQKWNSFFYQTGMRHKSQLSHKVTKDTLSDIRHKI